ncbi:Histidinol-phosphate aminotransferase [hydrothermal vent metagenome]|uniref:Histidinol-phosphate aminotransferase n=1 Tax=hydrothermal vent metagenome TaxID=652676 RepID=A0A3B1CMI0_9ZZZZ
MVDIKALLRDNIKNLKPYSSARDDYTGEVGIFLDANENSYGSIPEGDLNRYPDPHQRKLKKKLSEIKKISPKNIFIGNGSDEAIDLVIRAFCEPGKDKIMIMQPTYGMYKVAAKINDINIVEVPLTDKFEIDTESMLLAINEKVKIIFICSPNNPTGNILNENLISKILNSFNGLVVIDEAYIDFAKKRSWITELNNFNNLVVLQTFSKAWGLANIRVGMAFADEGIIEILNKIKYPYNVSGVSQSLILKALENELKKDKVVDILISERNKLTEALISLAFINYVFPSDANFLLAKVQNSATVYDYLLEKKIIVRNRSNMIHCNECLRFTIGTEEENKELIEALKKYGAER